MHDARPPIKIMRIPGGYTVNLADGRKLWIYGREPEVARAANAMTLDEAEALAKEVARALTEQLGRLMPWGQDRRILEIFDLADRKGFDVVKATMKGCVRLIGPDGKSVRNEKGGAAFSYAEARRYLGELPDQR